VSHSKSLKASAALQAVLRDALALTPDDRKQLVVLLAVDSVLPVHFETLQDAIRHEGVYMPKYSQLTEAQRKHLKLVCGALEAAFVPGATLRNRLALTSAVVRNAKRFIQKKGGVPTLSALLEVMARESWTKLLGNAFPGYPAALIGRALCGELSTGFPSSASTELPTEHAAPTSRPTT
jgi:hypothetical protein